MAKLLLSLLLSGFVDRQADPPQRAALEAIFRARYGSQFGTLRGPKFVPIAFAKKATDDEGWPTSIAWTCRACSRSRTPSSRTKPGNEASG